MEGKIYPVFLSLNNVKTFNAKGKENVEAWNELEVEASYKTAKNRDAMDFLKEGKFGVEKTQGIIANNIVDAFTNGDKSLQEKFKGTVYLVFDGNESQIKSATDNVGTFSSESNDIRFQQQPKNSSKNNNTVTDIFKSQTKMEQFLRDNPMNNGYNASELTRMFAQNHPLKNEIEQHIILSNVETRYENEDGEPCARFGMTTGVGQSSPWRVVKDFSGGKSHEQGGIDISVWKNGKVNVLKGDKKLKFEAKNGFLIPKSYYNGI